LETSTSILTNLFSARSREIVIVSIHCWDVTFHRSRAGHPDLAAAQN